ncbi:MAG: hypothetical protein VB022_08640 [Rikenellaceae bacterium]|nr:hypothetical protein [Rikenellaceae bacterium]
MIAFFIVLIYIAIVYLAIQNVKSENNPDFPQRFTTSLIFLVWPWWLLFVSAVYGGDKRKILFTALIGIIHSFSQTAIFILYWNADNFPFGEVLLIPGAIVLALSLLYFFWNKRVLNTARSIKP